MGFHNEDKEVILGLGFSGKNWGNFRVWIFSDEEDDGRRWPVSNEENRNIHPK